jgi:RNA polymerase sigma factor (sigma-70 family)
MAVAPLRAVLGRLRTAVDRESLSQASDRALLERFVAGGDERAFGAVLQRHGPMVLAVCRRVLHQEQDAEDVFQATFLLLATRAASIRKRDSVASWLYGVARRLALRSLSQRSCRQAHERRAAARRPTSTHHLGAACSELEAALDDALATLPEKYRLALLLCYFEGRTVEDAARQLGCPRGTVASRLARGRWLLRDRLAHNGLALSTAAVGTFLLAGTSPAALPPGLAQGTIWSALRLAAGGTPAAVASPTVALLLQGGGITIMTKLKLLISLLAIGFLVAVTMGVRGGAAPAVEARLDRQDAVTREKPVNAPALVALRGRALTGDGQPAASAKLFLVNNEGLLAELGVTAADGRFVVEVPTPRKLSGKMTWLAVKASGFGVDFVALDEHTPDGEVLLRLPRDLPIHGRLIDLQGRPVSGASVWLNSLSVYSADSVEAFLAGLMKRPDLRTAGAVPSKVLFGGSRGLLTTTTGKDGRFEFAGAGAERVVGLRFTGPGIAQTYAEVVARTGFNPEPYNAVTRGIMPKNGAGLPGSLPATMLQGPEPTVIAETEKPIRGLVSELGTGKPRPGVQVSLNKDNGIWLHHVLQARTDRHGRYEIRGASKAPDYTLTVESDSAAGMLRRSITVRDTPGYEPVTADLQTARGVVVTGQVTDGSTGKPVPSRIWIGPLADNPHARKPEYDGLDSVRAEETGLDGSFRIISIPGRVLLMAGPDSSLLPGGYLDSLRYRLPTADPRFPDYFQSDGVYLSYRVAPQGQTPVQGNCCKVLDVNPRGAEVRVDLVLERDTAMRLSLRDAAGRPLAGTWLHGLTSQRYTSAFWYESAEVTIYGVQNDKPRIFAVYDPKSKLTAARTLTGDEKQPVVVTLGPPGILKGRLLEPDGTPAAAVTVAPLYPDHSTEMVFKTAQEPDGCALTDKDGTFRIEHMIPGQPFFLLVSSPSKQGLFRTPTEFLADRRKFGPVKAAAITYLGNLTLKPAARSEDE